MARILGERIEADRIFAKKKFVGALEGMVTGAIKLDSHTVAELEALTAADYEDVLVKCSDGHAGVSCLAFCDGTNWLRVVFGAAVAIA